MNSITPKKKITVPPNAQGNAIVARQFVRQRCREVRKKTTNMDKDGYIVCRSVLSRVEVTAVRRGLSRDGCGNHCRVLWNVRCHPNVKKTFADVWKVDPDELLTSFDGAYRRRPCDEFTLPWHMDHNASHPSETLSSVQGILALTDVDETTGGTQFLSESHRHTRALCARLAAEEDPNAWAYTQVPCDDRVFRMGLAVVQPTLQPGDMLLWDSRLVHRVVAPTVAATERWTVYLSMAPGSAVDASVRRKRKRGFRKGVATTHWVQRFVDRGDDPIPPPGSVLADRGVQSMV